MSTSDQYHNHEKFEQLMLSHYSKVALAFIVLASLPFDPIWLVIAIILTHKALEIFLKSKTNAFTGVAFGVFYGIVGASPVFFPSSSNSYQKSLFFIMFAKYSQSSRLAGWVSLLTNVFILCLVNLDSTGFVSGVSNIFLQMWMPFLALLGTELPKSPKRPSEATLGLQIHEKAKPKHEDLLYENKMLREKLSSFEDFLATSFHELKNPLNIILGSLRLMIEQTSIQNEELLSNIKRAFASGEYLRLMITGSLDWRKNNFRDLEINYKEIDTLTFISKVWTICGTLIKNKNLQGFLRASKELPPRMLIDEQRMMQIIINMVTNAVKFTKKGYVSIEFQWVPTVMVFRKIDRNERPKALSALSEKKEGEKITVYSSGKHKFLKNRVNYFELNNKKEAWEINEKLSTFSTQGVLKIKVDDSGCGMSQSQIDQLFQKFSQVSLDTNINQMGSGLGLWISKQFIDKMNGTIKVSSVLNKGTTFEIAIPTKPSPPSLSLIGSIQKSRSPKSNNRAILLPDRSRDSSIEIPYESKKVLIVDDDQFNITLLRQWCKKQGYLTLEALNGKEAVLLVESNANQIGVILMDEEMPEMRGRDAISIINNFCQQKGMNKIPSFCLSGNSAPTFEEKCLKAGFDSVIQKPIDYETLKANLARLLRGKTE